MSYRSIGHRWFDRWGPVFGSIIILHVCAVNAFAASYWFSDDTIVYHENQFFVQLDDLVEEDTITAYLEDLNASEVWKSGHLDMALWEVDSFPFTTNDGQTISNIHEAIARSKNKSKIRSATLNVQQNINSLQPITQLPTNCFDISNFSQPHGDSSTIKVSILDTGISAIADNSDAEHNYNLTSYSGFDYVNNDPNPEDEHGHGSHIAGLIHSITHQTVPALSRIEFDIRKTHDSLGQAFLSTIVFALLDALDAEADIINMSFGYENIFHDSLFFPLQVAIEEANYRDALVVVAAGNGGIDNDETDSIALPASFPTENILSVASLDCNDQLSAFSNWGAKRVDIATLAESIPGPDLQSGIVHLSGTSQAAAIITATAALIATRLDDFKPSSLICPILRSAQHLAPMTDKLLVSGKLNFDEAFTISDSTCISNNFDCNKDFVGSSGLSGTTTGSDMYETDLHIESSQQIQNGSLITLDALLETKLLPGFEVSAGGILQVMSDGCQH